MLKILKLSAVAATIVLAACSTYDRPERHVARTQTTTVAQQTKTTTVAQGDIGGSVRRTMNTADVEKMSRALDKSPGKATTWQNTMSHTTYTVTPTKVVSVNGNNFCRNYLVIANTNGGKALQSSGTACVNGSDWKEVQ